MGTLNVDGAVPKINCNKPLKKINVNGVTVWEGIPDSIIAHKNGVSTNSEWVTGVMTKAEVAASSNTGRQEKTVATPFTLTDKAKQTYNTCTVVVGYDTAVNYGDAYVYYNGAVIDGGGTSLGTKTRTFTIGTSETFGSLGVSATGNVNYAVSASSVWIESITLSGKK